MKKLFTVMIAMSLSLLAYAENFKSGSITPTIKLQQELTILFETQIKNKNIEFILIEGHTDPVGSERNNQNLSERRAEAAKSFFVRLGANPLLIDTIGYGETKLISNINAENRRVVVKVKHIKKKVMKTIIADVPKKPVKKKPIVKKKLIAKKKPAPVAKKERKWFKPVRLGVEAGLINVEDFGNTAYVAVRPSIDFDPNMLNVGIEVSAFRTKESNTTQRAYALPGVAASVRVFDFVQVDYDGSFKYGIHYKVYKNMYIRGSIGQMRFNGKDNRDVRMVGIGYEF